MTVQGATEVEVIPIGHKIANKPINKKGSLDENSRDFFNGCLFVLLGLLINSFLSDIDHIQMITIIIIMKVETRETSSENKIGGYLDGN